MQNLCHTKHVTVTGMDATSIMGACLTSTFWYLYLQYDIYIYHQISISIVRYLYLLDDIYISLQISISARRYLYISLQISISASRYLYLPSHIPGTYILSDIHIHWNCTLLIHMAPIYYTYPWRRCDRRRPAEVYQTYIACKSEVVGQNVGVVYVWVCQKVGVAMHKMFAFFFSLMYTTTFLDATFWTHASYDWWAAAPTTHCKPCATWHSVHFSGISWKYGHLKSTRPVPGKSKTVRLRSKCGICVGVSRSGRGEAMHFLFSSYMYVRNHVPKPHILKIMKVCAMRTGLLQYI